MIEEITSQSIKEYIKSRPELRVEVDGRFYKCRIGERSHATSVYTSKHQADKALEMHVGSVLKAEQKRVAKRKAKDAKKSKS